MIFENNYTYAGTTAIIYNFELNYNELGFYILNNSKIALPENSLLYEIGIEYKKETDAQWETIVIANNEALDNIKNGSNTSSEIKDTETENYLFNSPIGAKFKLNEHISPIHVVIKNLEENTTYSLRSYYKLSNLANNLIDTRSIPPNIDKYTFNSCEATTMQSQDIHYQCTEVTGGTEEQNNKLLNTINKACDIYNCMTSFKIATAKSDYINSHKGGSFTAVQKVLGGGAANDRMQFNINSIIAIRTVCHEIAHNLMYEYIDETKNEYAYNKIVKFMEFATGTHEATWKWLGSHCYPIMTTYPYTGVYNYLVAAACYVCRDASNRI